MKGHIRERGKGNWYAVIDLRDPTTGKRKRKWHSLKAGGKREAQIECAALVASLDAGTYAEPTKTTLGEFLGRWLAHIKTQVSPKSHERYASIVNQNLVPALGAVRLVNLRPMQISEAYSDALTSGRKDGKEGGLSPRTVGHMHRVLKQALSQALRWKELTHNPADAVDPPKIEWRPMKAYDIEQTAAALDLFKGGPLYVPMLLSALCGLRRGEVCALRWRNVDLVGASISIVESIEQTKAGLRFKSPKSGKGRTVALPASVVDELRAHRARRAQDLLKLGVRLTDDDLVLGHADGSMMTPIYVSQIWARQIAKSKLPRIRFHDLRHTHATHLLANGVHPKVASERLGHSRVGITLDLYSHVMPGMQEDAAAMVDAAIRAASAKREG